MPTDQMKLRQYQIISDATGNYEPIDAIAQFMYKGYIVSMSTAGLSKGACQTKVQVFDPNAHPDFDMVCPAGFTTVSGAIDYIDTLFIGT